MGKYHEAEWYADHLILYPNLKEPISGLAGAMLFYLQEFGPKRCLLRRRYLKPYIIKECLEDIEVDISSEYRDIYLDNIRFTENLLVFWQTPSLNELPNKEKCTGLSIVLNTGYKYAALTSYDELPKYNANNPSGWRTGQWMDVKVIDGEINYKQPYNKNEIIKGIWSKGEDTIIVGKPKIGDIVLFCKDYHDEVCGDTPYYWKRIAEKGKINYQSK